MTRRSLFLLAVCICALLNVAHAYDLFNLYGINRLGLIIDFPEGANKCGITKEQVEEVVLTSAKSARFIVDKSASAPYLHITITGCWAAQIPRVILAVSEVRPYTDLDGSKQSILWPRWSFWVSDGRESRELQWEQQIEELMKRLIIDWISHNKARSSSDSHSGSSPTLRQYVPK
jgi:hypothetical protein